MTYPGFQANQQAQLAAQVAQASASRAAQQNAAFGAQLGHRHPHYPTRRGGPLSMIGRVVSTVFTLAVLLIMAIIGLVVLGTVDPHAAELVWHWLDELG